MSHSTHVGLNFPPATGCGAFRKWIALPSSPFSGTVADVSAVPSFQSRAVGVGHICTATRSGNCRLIPSLAFASRRHRQCSGSFIKWESWASIRFGVGHITWAAIPRLLDVAPYRARTEPVEV